MSNSKLSVFMLVVVLASLVFAATYIVITNPPGLLIGFTIAISIVLIIQGILTLIWMGYAWGDPANAKLHVPPEEFLQPQVSFTTLLPARHEENVIQDTIEAVNRIDYPDHLKEILVICRQDDTETIARAQETIDILGNPNIKLVIFDGYPINKPHSLNQGLNHARNDVVCIFDAEDEPHPDIFNVVNTILLEDTVDVVQSGVQLINYQSRWFSTFNVLEYYFWFKSGLPFFSSKGEATLLGGNTVFFKRDWLDGIGGWDQENLTEDADVALRLVAEGATIKVVYDAQHATREETPSDVKSFIKQRTRWNQGFLQTFLKGDWRKLPKLRQKLTILFMLLDPFLVATLLLYLPVGIWLALTQRIPVSLALFSFIPLQLLIAQLVTFIIGLREFARTYELEYPTLMPLKLLVTFYPYQFLLMVSAFRAVYRAVVGQAAWEKTAHANLHRQPAGATAVRPARPRPAPAYTQMQPSSSTPGTNGHAAGGPAAAPVYGSDMPLEPQAMPLMFAMEPQGNGQGVDPLIGFQGVPDLATQAIHHNGHSTYVTLMLDIDMSKALAFLDQVNEDVLEVGSPSTMTAFIIKAVAWALHRHPALNGHRYNGHVIPMPNINVGVAIAVEDDLVVPVVQDAHHKGVGEINTEIAEKSTRARGGSPEQDDSDQGTFTVTDLSMFGVDRFITSVNFPQVGNLAVGQMSKRLVPNGNGGPAERPTMTFTLTADRKAVNDAQAAHFMLSLRKALENPVKILI
jgi:cellulose synthase/poly-beta-1,6-N-acetylglucosamine synthase-like glycosyltransferase/pyruvate/2-oxoglutarate dehydrogenase complex dihydrolipoamide acyltransferase (E2) component